jgi:hypothetical protein
MAYFGADLTLSAGGLLLVVWEGIVKSTPPASRPVSIVRSTSIWRQTMVTPSGIGGDNVSCGQTEVSGGVLLVEMIFISEEATI